MRALQLVGVPEQVREVRAAQSGGAVVTGDQSLVTGDVVAERGERGAGDRLYRDVVVSEQRHDQRHVEAGLAQHDTRRPAVTCPPHVNHLSPLTHVEACTAVTCPPDVTGSVAEWLACWTHAQKGPGSNRSRDAVG